MSAMGDRIHQKRKEYKLTMEELGKMLGVNKTAVNKWEKGEVKNIKQSTIYNMSKIFNCSPAWLMGFGDIENEDTTELVKLSIEETNLIEIWRTLTEEEKQAVMVMLTFKRKKAD